MWGGGLRAGREGDGICNHLIQTFTQAISLLCRNSFILSLSGFNQSLSHYSLSWKCDSFCLDTPPPIPCIFLEASLLSVAQCLVCPSDSRMRRRRRRARKLLCVGQRRQKENKKQPGMGDSAASRHRTANQHRGLFGTSAPVCKTDG